MALNYDNIQIDKELEDLLPPLSKEDYNILESSLVRNGFQEQFGKIKVWFPDGGKQEEKSIGYIVDGHNRYRICKKNNVALPYWCYEFVFFDSKEEVIKWMYENQIARRNLSPTEKYKIVEKYSTLLYKMAKKNQSDGGKGLSNLTNVNVRKEKAKLVGVSEGSYHKLDKVMKSNNETVKEQLRKKEISIDKAYQQITHPITEPKEILTPEQKIKEIDNRVNEINKEIDKLNQERKSLVCRRCVMFEGLDIVPAVKFGWTTVGELSLENVQPILWKCEIYMEHEGHKEMFGKYDVFFNEYPSCFWYTTEENRLKDIPEKYKNDFTMAWKQAHDELVKKQEEFEERIRESAEKQRKAMEDVQRLSAIDDADRVILKKFYRVLATTFHPDSPDGDAEMMRCVNVLKEIWGV